MMEKQRNFTLGIYLGQLVVIDKDLDFGNGLSIEAITSAQAEYYAKAKEGNQEPLYMYHWLEDMRVFYRVNTGFAQAKEVKIEGHELKPVKETGIIN